MINKICQGVQSIRLNPAFKGEISEEETQTVTSPIENNVNFKGADALSNYNVGMFMLNNKLDVEVLNPMIVNPEDVDDIEGEKIYTSDNKLVSITKDNGDTKTRFVFDTENPGKLIGYCVTDNETGNNILTQTTTIYGDDEQISIDKIDKETGKITNSALYTNGELNFASKTIQKPNGGEEEIYLYADGTYRISSCNKNGNLCRSIYFDKNKQISEIYESRELKNRELNSRVDLYNGSIVSVSRTENIIIPNNIGKEVFLNSEVVPADKFVINKDYKGLKGEKTYYSNGVIETNTIEDGTIAKFSPEGELIKLILPDKEILLDGDMQEIKEKLSDTETKTTKLYPNGSYNVIYKNDEIRKEANFDENGIPSYYEEDALSNSEDYNYNYKYKHLSFNKDGMLDYAN